MARELSREAVGVRSERRIEVRGLSRARLAWLHATRRGNWAFALWLCLGLAIALVGALSLIDGVSVESGLDDVLARDGAYSVEQNLTTVDGFSAFQRDVDGQVTRHTGRALSPITSYAGAGPLYPVTLNGLPAPSLSGASLDAAYLDHLAAHVDLVAGQIPAEGLGGGETAITMPKAGADQLGLRLADRFCVDFVKGGDRQPRWCARIVGLWQPLDPGGAFWGGRTPRLMVAMGRYDMFEMARLKPGNMVTGVRYQANPDVVDASGAAAVGQQVAVLTDAMTNARYRVTTGLDQSLERFDAGRRWASSTLHLFMALVMLFVLAAIGLVAARFLDGQTRELSILRARGWPPDRIRLIAFWGLALLALWAVPLGLVGCLGVLAVLTAAGLSALSLHSTDLVGTGLAILVLLLGIFAVLLRQAAVAASRDETPLRDDGDPPRRSGWRQPGVALILAAAGIVALVLSRLPGIGGLIVPAPPDLPGSLTALVPALGVVLLAAAMVALRPLGARVASLQQDTVAGVLAARQIDHDPEQHAGVALVLILIGAIAVFSALAVALAVVPGSGEDGPPILHQGLAIALAAGFLGCLTLGLVGFGLHFLASARRRLREYVGLFAHGLPVGHMGQSLATEQGVTIRSSLLVGALLGLLLALAGLPLTDPLRLAVPAVVALAVAATCLLGGTLAVGAVVRRLPKRVNPLREL